MDLREDCNSWRKEFRFTMCKRKRSASNRDWLYLTLLRKFQHICLAAVLSTIIAFFNTDLSFFFDTDLVYVLDLLFSILDEFMSWMNVINWSLHVSELTRRRNFPM